MDQLQAWLDQIDRDNQFHNWVMGSYEHKGAYRSLLEGLHRESQYGTKMDLDGLNQRFYDDVRLGVERYAGEKLRNANDTQKAGIRAALGKLRNVVTADDIFPERRPNDRH